MKNISRFIPYKIKLLLLQIWINLNKDMKEKIKVAFLEQEKMGMESIPIFIVSYNRLSYLKKLIENLEKRNYTNIYIIDNNSSYPPLIEYYNDIPYKIFRLNENLGHMAFWKSNIFNKYRNNFYIVTDPDVIPIDDCPNDFIYKFFKYLEQYPFVRKVGFSLKIDDLPKDSIFNKNIIEWEKQFYQKPINDDIYFANLDTTFALYLPDNLYNFKNFYRAIRTAYPYAARHLPWYKKTNELTEEDQYYSKHKTNGWWDPVKGFAKDEDRYNI